MSNFKDVAALFSTTDSGSSSLRKAGWRRFGKPPLPSSRALSKILRTLSDCSFCLPMKQAACYPRAYVSVCTSVCARGCVHLSVCALSSLIALARSSLYSCPKHSCLPILYPCLSFGIWDLPPFFCLPRACVLHHLWLRFLLIWLYRLLWLALVI